MKKRKFLNKILCGGVFVLVVWRVSAWFPETDFLTRKILYQRVIREVKASKMKIGEQRSWKMGLMGNLRIVNSADALTNKVVAWRMTKGYIVSIVTSDRGHFGMSGYLFSDTSLVMRNDQDWGMIPAEIPETWLVDRHINKNWWAVYNNLE